MEAFYKKKKSISVSLHFCMTAEKVKFNVRGKILETTTSTLAAARRDSMFGAMFDDEWKLQPKGDEKEYFIDRDPDCFSVLLNLLGTGKLHVPSNIPEKLLYMEAHYYGLLDHVRTAKWGEFDSNRLRLTGSVSGQAPRNCSAIRASPDGGCAVAHGGVVRVYDWMLEEHPPLNLEYQSVNDIGWMDSDNIVMAVSQNLDRPGVGGMGVFSALTGELRQRFQLSDGEDQVKGFAAGALCFNTDSNKVLASCRDITSNQGIGVWDQETGKQTDFFDFGLGSREKIQWFNGRNCLLVYSDINYKRRINLLDFRDKKSVVWSWPDDTKTCHSDTHIHDAIPMEEGNSICVVDPYRTLGFLDLRDTTKSVRWNLYRGKDTAQRGYSKLTLHGGQIFYSVGDRISVYYYDGLDQWVLTSNLERSQGGSIRDFSISGDRLFALHSEKNVFDVWETPSALIV
ncbi:BTB/POZ domain-containing protein At2g24240-like [Papaver somniferum]|uniref:BTB/POZ domain-containing protein At2g24240-like n=1 Tax=Papaver somniferum TaxID=3469 RepID=UPI000E6FD2A2|nr:BTB/POZ domain-containing protein At2g24240-like [Papaver somniferum]